MDILEEKEEATKRLEDLLKIKDTLLKNKTARNWADRTRGKIKEVDQRISSIKAKLEKAEEEKAKLEIELQKIESIEDKNYDQELTTIDKLLYEVEHKLLHLDSLPAPRKRCECGKVSFDSIGQAKSLRRSSISEGREMRIYFSIRCNCYHLTSQNIDQKEGI